MDQDTGRITEHELSRWIAFDQAGIQRVLVARLAERFETLSDAWMASRSELISVGGLLVDAAEKVVEKRKQVDPDKLLDIVRSQHMEAIAQSDPLYPIRLRQIKQSPLVLYVKGEFNPLHFTHMVAIVGTRRPSAYGSRIAKDFGRGFAENGIPVVSGMALGIDSLAHWGAIEGGGKTYAIVATGPDLCYPSTNKRLYDAILEQSGAAIISEYFPGTRPEKWHFPERNRIISGLCQAVVVIEAGEQSGALITADLGFNQTSNVYAVPGRIDSPMSIGTNRLIADTKAKLITSHMDVINDEQLVKVERAGRVETVVQLYGREKEVYELLSNEPIHFDMLCQQTEMQAGEMSATLTMLELAGLAKAHPGDWYSREAGSYVKS